MASNPTQTATLRERAHRALYGSAHSGGGSLNQVDNSFWLPRIAAAKSRNNHLLAEKLEAQRAQFFAAVGELKASPDQARRLAVRLRDASPEVIERNRTLVPRLRNVEVPVRDRLTEAEELQLQEKHGANAQALVQRGYAAWSKALEGKPDLLEAAKRCWGHGELADVLVEIAAATPPDTTAPARPAA